MAQTDPENEIGDVKTPENRPPDSSHADPGIDLPSERAERGDDDAAEKGEERPIAPGRSLQRPQEVVGYLLRRFRCHAMNPFAGT
jgi:hypothetical protein